MIKKLPKMMLLILFMIAGSITSLADETTLASWTFDKAYDTQTTDGVTVYTPNSSNATDVTGWFNSVTPCFLPNTYTGTQTDYSLTTKSGRYFQLCAGYNNRVLRMDNSGGANSITDFTDGSKHNNYYEISFPTINYKDINISYACAYGANASATLVAVVSTDGGNTWVNAGSNPCANTWWTYNTNTVAISAQNKAKVIVRLIAGNDYASNWNMLNITVKGTYSTDFKTQYTLSAVTNIAGAGVITTNPSGTELDEGTNVSLTATANFGYRFVNWTDNNTGAVLSDTKTFSLTMDKAQSVTANFETVATYELTYNVEGLTSNHLVSVAPNPTIVNGKKMYEAGTDVTLTASDNEVLSFLYWDNGASTGKSYTVTMNADRNVVATYTGSNYICGWDLYSETPKSNRDADFYADDTNKGTMNLTNGTTTKTWLSHTNWVGHQCAISWQDIAEKYYFQWQFATTDKKNITFKLTASAINYSRYTTYNLQYSTDNATWATVETFDFTTNTGWTTKSVTLPSAADNQAAVYVRLIPADDATVAGSGKDCISATDIYVTYDNGTDTSDKTAPTLVSSLPESGSANVSTTGSVVLTFDENIALNDGAYGVLDGEHITPTINGKIALFAYSALDYDKAYTFSLPANSITDASGNAYAKDVTVSFTTCQRNQPAARLYDAVIAQDGTGDFTTIQAAINAAPENRANPYLIFIKAGTYTGHVDIPSTKPYLYFIGEGRDLVSIEDKKLEGTLGSVVPIKAEYELQADGTAFSVYDGATVVCQAANVYFEGVNFVNSYGRDEKNGPQALALFANSDRFVANKCGLISFQDTYLTAWNSQAYRQYIKNSWIEGAVDFIYGGGDVYFDHDTINIVRQNGGYIVAPSHTTESKWGYVFDHNVITSNLVSDPKETKCYFGRPWTNQPKTVFLHTQCEISTYDGLWYDHMGGLPQLWAVYDMWDKDGKAMSTTSISEYYYTDKTTGTKVTGTAKNSLTDEEAATYTLKNVLRGSDSWQPELLCDPVDAPQLTMSGNVISWDAVPYAMCYVILENGRVISFTKDTNYSLPAQAKAKTAADDAVYTVKAANEFGGLSEASNAVGHSTTAIKNVTTENNVYNTYYNMAGQRVNGNAKGIVIMNGKKIIMK